MIDSITKQKIDKWINNPNFDKTLNDLIKYSFSKYDYNDRYESIITIFNVTKNNFLCSDIAISLTNTITNNMVDFTICDSIMGYVAGQIIQKYGVDVIRKLYDKEMKSFLINMKIDRINGDF